MVADAEHWREQMVESAAEATEELMEKYLEGGELTEEEIKLGFEGAYAGNNEIVPALCGSAFKNKGVQAMLDARDRLSAGSHRRSKPIEGVLDDDETVDTRGADDDAPFAALAFKIATDPFVGTLTFFRVYSGVLSSGDQIYNPVKSKKERVGRMVQMHSNNRNEIKEVRAGDIAAAIGLKDVTTGDTLCAQSDIITLERMEFPEPVISVAVEPKSVPDQEKMGVALGKLAQEDPSFRVETDEESGQTIISGMGELHLDIIVDRMKREFNVEANIGKPQVAYRETIRSSVDQEGKFVRQSGGRGQYGHVWVKRRSHTLTKKVARFTSLSTRSSAVPYRGNTFPAVNKGIQEQMQNGVIAGYPLIGVRATLHDGSFHEVDSSEMASRSQGRWRSEKVRRMPGRYYSNLSWPSKW